LTRALVRWRRIGAVEEPYAYVRRMDHEMSGTVLNSQANG